MTVRSGQVRVSCSPVVAHACRGHRPSSVPLSVRVWFPLLIPWRGMGENLFYNTYHNLLYTSYD